MDRVTAPEVKSERWSITARFLLNVDDSHTTVEPPGCLTLAERDPFWIAKALRKKQPSFFGHPPQVPVGHVFESFSPVMETGLHPTHVQAVAGTSKEGVRSMKMGRERNLVNMDRLDSIVCFTNGTHSRRGGQPDIDATFSNERNKPWLTSMLSNKPIRVVVSSSTTSPFAPQCGPDGEDKWHYRGLFTCRGAYVVEVDGLYRIYVSLEALSREHTYRPPLEHGVVEDSDGKESDDDDDDDDDDGDDDGQKGGASRKRKRRRRGTTTKEKRRRKKRKRPACQQLRSDGDRHEQATTLEPETQQMDEAEVEVEEDDDDDAIEVDFPPSRQAVADAGPHEAAAAQAALCCRWSRESAVAAHIMFGTPPSAANLDLDHRLGYVLAVGEEKRLAADSFAGLPLFQLHAYLIRHRSAHLSDRLTLPELLGYLNSLPLFQLRERAVAVHARLRAEAAHSRDDPRGGGGERKAEARIAEYLCSLEDLTQAHVGIKEPEQGLPCYFLTNACLFDQSGGMVSLERVRPDARASVVGQVTGHPSTWVLAAPASPLHLDYGMSGLWLRVDNPFRAWIRVMSGSELYTPLFVSTLRKARMAYAVHDHIRHLPACVRTKVTFRWLVAKGTYSEADIASAAAFLYDHLEQEHPGVPCIDHLDTLPRPEAPKPRAPAMLVPHWADTEHRLVWVAQQMPRGVAIEPRLGIYTEPPEEREGKRKADPKPSSASTRKSSRRTSRPPSPSRDKTSAH
ncbi:uncharacterized protein ACA1_139560 [Acanthamoeba castellanii str. Neff]|uniref:YDG domain-containing protein n=1 Tax=Acanthamoeba castellanii (strain ATCC 30010 / Neff) TaxID=1257118 RepID=L8GN24_ACACF|nr:uncharacterized protein ACA1_139560 [Acanthamoeba castellanii str. Neff]ELR14229.1 hypothetical protein ACA1_139560 [Acanthamoeba castellanii str. Neff]